MTTGVHRIRFLREEQHFCCPSGVIEMPSMPLTVTLQLTRRCNLNCIYCSESLSIDDSSLTHVRKMIDNLRGVPRVILAGGEPTLRGDLPAILRQCRENFQVVAMATNAARVDAHLARTIAKYVDYVDVTIDGPRKVHNKVRGEFDSILQGVRHLTQAGIPFSVVTVLLVQNRCFLRDTIQIADALGARKVKVLSPIPKGRGKLVAHEAVDSQGIHELFREMKAAKRATGWTVRIAVTDWTRIREGHAILVHPDGTVVASPVWTERDCILPLGNVISEDIQSIWKRYPFKSHHLRKYTERSLLVC
jgi:MoaA/NifB/PqqE/SkfB family radical SAM enzyme